MLIVPIIFRFLCNYCSGTIYLNNKNYTFWSGGILCVIRVIKSALYWIMIIFESPLTRQQGRLGIKRPTPVRHNSAQNRKLFFSKNFIFWDEKFGEIYAPVREKMERTHTKRPPASYKQSNVSYKRLSLVLFLFAFYDFFFRHLKWIMPCIKENIIFPISSLILVD